MNRLWQGILFSFLSILIFSCSIQDEPPGIPQHQTTPFLVEIPPGFPTQMNIPEDNPLTVEGVALGRFLFYDGRVAGHNSEEMQISCASCHLQEHAFTIGEPRPSPLGVEGMPTHHGMLPLINLIWNPGTFGWNGSATSIEEVVKNTITDPLEFNSTFLKVETAIANIDGYPELFNKAFGSDEVTVDRVAKAIAQFVRTLTSSDSKFDRYLRGEIQLSQAELNGFVLFTTEEGADCFHCHGAAANPLFTTHLFYNNGKDSLFVDPLDRYSITSDNEDLGAYKASTLRNIEWTAPYMHDGRFNTLDEVIDFYSSGLVWTPYINPLMHHIATGGNQLTPTEKENLKAFLLTLSDDDFIVNPDFGPPDHFPDEF